ncbi:MAG: hypothetical protein QOD24_2761, partial [Solirubrobacteraceae bacterium]|nr:hypothetical protein [Solirubrobacteraceae bacterium]
MPWCAAFRVCAKRREFNGVSVASCGLRGDVVATLDFCAGHRENRAAMESRSALAAAGLLERERELERLERAISAAVDGAGSVVAIEGEAGIGKTSLVGYATGCGSSAGMRVLRARGGELEREFALGVVRQLFEVLLASATRQDRDRWLAGAAGLSAPVLSSVPVGDGAGQEPSSVLHGLYWLSANLSVEQPLLIAVDDAQWADTASIRFISYLAPR